MSAVKTRNVWECKIGGAAGRLPEGSDLPMRRAVAAAYEELTGESADFCFSGWGGALTPGQASVATGLRIEP